VKNIHGVDMTGSGVAGFVVASDILTQYSLYKDPHPVDVVQGDIGDCWLISAMSAIAAYPSMVANLFGDQRLNDVGIYYVFGVVLSHCTCRCVSVSTVCGSMCLSMTTCHATTKRHTCLAEPETTSCGFLLSKRQLRKKRAAMQRLWVVVAATVSSC